jgi:Glycosyltransferase Family 4
MIFEMKTIAFSNYLIHRWSGTETFLLDVTTALSRRGYQCGIYTPRKGGMAQEFERRGVPVWNRAEAMTLRPDVLHCQHNLETLRLCHQFPETPALFMVHDSVFWADETPPLPQLRCVATVSEYIRERVVRDTRLPSDRIPLIFNGVDLSRFKPRAKLPDKPQNIALFSSNVAGTPHVNLCERVARTLGLKLEKIGAPFGNLVVTPEEVLGSFDLVLSVGRCAIEALCVGCAVILIGPQGVGELVTTENFMKFRRRNFGLSLLVNPLEEAVLERAILSYDADQASEVARIARERCDIERTVDDLVALYETLPECPPLCASRKEWVDSRFLIRCFDHFCQDHFSWQQWADDLDGLRRRHEQIMQDLVRQVEEQQCACAGHLAALDIERQRTAELDERIKVSEETIESLKQQIHRLEIDSSFWGFLARKFRLTKSRDAKVTLS